MTYQVSVHVEYFPSLIWEEPLAELFFPTLRSAEPRFDRCCFHEIRACAWLDIARVAEKIEDQLRTGEAIPAAIWMMWDAQDWQFRSAGMRRQTIEALQLTSQWIREHAAKHSTLTFYGI